MMLTKKVFLTAGALLASCTTAGVYAQGSLTCADAVVAVDGDNAYNNAGATLDMDYTGLCDMGQFGTDFNYNTVWFKWVAATTDTYTVSNCNVAGGVDTRFSAQTDCTAASVVGCNDDGAGCANFSSIMTFAANAGTTYYIAVGVYSATTVGGPGTMNISAGGGGGGGGGCGTGGDCCISNPGTMGCIDTECCDTVCAADAYCCATEWDQICADQAAVMCTACGAGGCSLPPFGQAEVELCSEDTNGGCNAGGASEPASFPVSIGGSYWSSAAMRDTDWYSFTTSEGTEITATLYSNIPAFCALVDANACTIVGTVSTGSCPSTMLTACVGPGSYYIVALPSAFAEFPCGGSISGDYVLELSAVTCTFTPPAGDDCANAVVATLGANPFDNSNAGTSVPDVTCGFGGAPFTKDVFFTFVAPATDGYTLQTCDSSMPFDTGVEVWDSCPDTGGMMLFCNDDGPGCVNYSSLLAAQLVQGVTYVIRVGGWNGAIGATELNITQGAPVGPANDDCSDAAVAIIGSNAFDTNGSTTDGPNPTDPSCGQFGAGFYNDVWFSLTTPTTEGYLVSLCSATWDTRLDVYASCGGALVVCNDDACGTLASEVTIAATAGSTYRIRIGGYGAANFGVGDMVISAAGGGGGGGGAGLTCATPVALAMGATPFTRVGATVDLDFTGFCDMGQFGTDFNYNCIFYTFTPTEAGLYRFSTCGTAGHDTRLSASTVCNDVTTVVGCNDDGADCTLFTSIMDVQLECDVEYSIALGGYSATTPLGTGTLNVTVTSPVACGTPCVGDYNLDGIRNGADLATLLSSWGAPAGDITGDGTTSGPDLTTLLSGWGLCP